MPRRSRRSTVPLKKSANRRLLATAQRKFKRFPSSVDLVEYHIAQGNIRGIHDLYRDKLELLSNVSFDWLRYGQLACQFAVALSLEPVESRWFSLVVDGILRDDAAETLALVLDSEDWVGAEAIQFVFPDLATPEHVVALVNNLCRSERWYWVKEAGSRGHVSIGLRWILPSDKCVSWALGFAPYEDMPFTRRAPFTMLVLRTLDSDGPEFSGKPRGKELGRSTVHLADMHLGAQWTEERKERYTRVTKENKELHLAGEFKLAARARVTFSVPTACARLLSPPKRS